MATELVEGNVPVLSAVLVEITVVEEVEDSGSIFEGGDVVWG